MKRAIEDAELLLNIQQEQILIDGGWLDYSDEWI